MGTVKVNRDGMKRGKVAIDDNKLVIGNGVGFGVRTRTSKTPTVYLPNESLCMAYLAYPSEPPTLVHQHVIKTSDTQTCTV